MTILLLAALALSGCLPGTPIPALAEAPGPTAAPTPTEDPGHWELVRTLQLENQPRMVAFFDENLAISGGPNSSGIARVTTDGGQTWVEAENSSGCLFSLEIIDPQTFWQCNASDLRISTDGGQSWMDEPRGAGQPGCRLSAIDAQTAWYLNPRTLFLTTDGAQTRQEMTLPEGVIVNDVAGIYLHALDDGRLVDLDGNLYTTQDAGLTWSEPVSLGLDRFGELELIFFRGLPSVAMRFYDNNNGLIALSLVGGGKNTMAVIRTRDGGQTWVEEEVPAPFGVPYLSQDGKYLTVVSFLNYGEVSLYHFTGGE